LTDDRCWTKDVVVENTKAETSFDHPSAALAVDYRSTVAVVTSWRVINQQIPTMTGPQAEPRHGGGGGGQ